MAIYTFRVRLLPNPPLQFEPDGDVWRDIKIDSSHTLAAFHEEIDRFIDQAVPEDTSDDAKQRFRELQSNPPTEGNAADTTIDELTPEDPGAISYTFDMGDNREHYIELQDTRHGSLESGPVVANEQGAPPPQYPDPDE